MPVFPNILKNWLKATWMLFFLPAFLSMASAQDTLHKAAGPYEQDPLNHIKTGPFALLLSQIPFTGEARLLYERVVAPLQASQIGISYIYRTPLLPDTFSLDPDLVVRGFRLQAMHKFYVVGELFDGRVLYLGPLASFNRVKLYMKDDPYNWFSFNYTNLSLVFGFQEVFFKVLTVDTYMGMGYRYNFMLEKEFDEFAPERLPIPTDLPRSNILSPNNPIKFSFAINMGYSF